MDAWMGLFHPHTVLCLLVLSSEIKSVLEHMYVCMQFEEIVLSEL